jgi:PAS domain S-box-containing protein
VKNERQNKNLPTKKNRQSWQWIMRYGLALGATGLAALLRWLLPWALTPAPYLGFYPAVVVSAALGGLGPGLLATFASLLLVNFVFGRFNIADHGAMMRQVIWVAASIGVSLLAEMQRKMRQRAENEADSARASEHELRQQAEMLRLSFDAIIVWRLDGGIESWNVGAEELYGFTKDEAIGRISHELLQTVHPVPWTEISAQMHQIGRWEGELLHRAKDGREIIVSARKLLIRGNDGIVHVMETNRDITERKQAEEKLVEAMKAITTERDRLSSLINSISDEVWYTDSEGKISLVNPAGLQEFGSIEVGEPIEKIVERLKILRPDGTPCPVEESPIFKALRGEAVGAQEEIVYFPEKEEQRYRQVGASPVKDGDGNIIGTVSVVRDITDYKKAEKQIVREKELQQLLLDHFPGVVVLLRRPSREVVVSNKAAREVGAVCGTKCFETWGQSPSPCSWCMAPDLWETGEHQQVEIDTGEKVFEAHWVPVSDDLYLHYSFDITDRKKAERLLQEKEQMIQQALNVSHSFTFDWDTATDQVLRSDSCRNIFGRAGDEIFHATAQRYFERVHPYDRQRVEKLLGNLTAAADTYVMEYRIIINNEDVKSLEEIAKGFFDDTGKMTRVVGVATDITERRQIEEAIKRQTSVLLAINNIFQEAIGAGTEKQLGEKCLKIAEELTRSEFGFIGEINERGLEDIAISDPGWDNCQILDADGHRPPPGNFEIHGLYGKVIKDGKGFFTNEPASHPDSIGLPQGHPPLKSFLGVPLIKDGKVSGIIALANGRDGYTNHAFESLEALTPAIVEAFSRKQAEELLKKAHDELEIRVRERTAELNETVNRLEKANQELEEFAYIASHDLQEPLRKIQTFGDMARKRCVPLADQTGRDYLDRVLQSAGRMRQLLQELLTLSRVTSQKQPFKKINLTKIAQEAADVFEAVLKETGGQITIDNLPMIEADEGQIRQLFQNLIGNALKFRDDRAPAVQVHGRVIDQGLCEVIVKDNGIGFDPEFAEVIFKPFERLHDRSTYEGTGMGLAICRKILERHGGTIRAESEPGNGATFIIRLPVRQTSKIERLQK